MMLSCIAASVGRLRREVALPPACRQKILLQIRMPRVSCYGNLLGTARKGL
jgi:hypothetical protein